MLSPVGVVRVEICRVMAVQAPVTNLGLGRRPPWTLPPRPCEAPVDYVTSTSTMPDAKRILIDLCTPPPESEDDALTDASVVSTRMYIETHTNLSHLASSLLPLPPTSQSYLLSLYTLTLERDALLSQISHHHEYRVDSSRKLFDLERDKLEDDYRKARDGVRQMLLDKVDERRKRLREEKDGGDVMGQSTLLHRVAD